MKCHELMKKDVQCCSVYEPVSHVAAKMRDKNIGFMPVCDAGGRAVGTITDRDLTIRVLADQRPGETTRLEEVMSRGVIACTPNDDLQVAERLMGQHKVARMLCVDQFGRPVGVISLSDVVDIEKDEQASAVLRSVAQRELRT